MLTYTSLGGATVQLANGKKTLLVFPGKTVSKDMLALRSAPEEQPVAGTISWPGEYDLDGVSVRGIGHNEGAKVSFVVEIDDVRTAFIAPPLHDWSDYDLELLGEVDVLVLPAEDVKIAQKIIDEVDPRVLIPLPTKEGGDFKELLGVCGVIGKESVDEYKLKSKSGLPAEGREVVVLKPRR
ncbi:MAG: hypothetical protein PHH13_01240 [Candidatus Peribacteraceae bacterium]|nr:hypothetical protein [Candidatus Peribacteraceae bacterium]